jgi:hypothetical protein
MRHWLDAARPPAASRPTFDLDKQVPRWFRDEEASFGIPSARDVRGMTCGRMLVAAASPLVTSGDVAESAVVCKTVGVANVATVLRKSSHRPVVGAAFTRRRSISPPRDPSRVPRSFGRVPPRPHEPSRPSNFCAGKASWKPSGPGP